MAQPFVGKKLMLAIFLFQHGGAPRENKKKKKTPPPSPPPPPILQVVYFAHISIAIAQAYMYACAAEIHASKGQQCFEVEASII